MRPAVVRCAIGRRRARFGRFAPGLEVAKSAAYLSSVALRVQAADSDVDVALVLRRIVADEIGRQVERIDLLLGGMAP